MKELLITLSLVFYGATAFSTTWVITNSGTTFSPAAITIILGDDINFSLEPIHNAVEVSLATWNSNGNTAIAGGFLVPFGGGQVTADKLGVGIHYFVCSPHAGLGMKGTITVETSTGMAENRQEYDFSVYPNPADHLMTVIAREDLLGKQLYILDLSGRVVYNSTIRGKSTPLDISRFTPGVYMINTPGRRKLPVKFIKEL